jgi:hypothetical protein
VARLADGWMPLGDTTEAMIRLRRYLIMEWIHPSWAMDSKAWRPFLRQYYFSFSTTSSSGSFLAIGT